MIFLTFKDVKSLTWKDCRDGLGQLVVREILRHRETLERAPVPGRARETLDAMVNREASPKRYEDGLRLLSEALHHASGQPVVILIDEYDTPLHAGYANGYYEDVIGFLRNFLSGGLKDNEHLFKGVLTGVLRVAKESVFSGLNNLVTYSLLSPRFSDCFGFTEPEVAALLESHGMADRLPDLAAWYNGYRFGDTTIYNPWSVLNFVDNAGECVPYWVNTADTGLIDRLATRGGRELRREIGTLLEGGTIRQRIMESIVMRDLERTDDLLWSFLLFSGYLTPVAKAGTETWDLRIPNREVGIIYQRMVHSWFAEKSATNPMDDLLESLDRGEVKPFGRLLRQVVLQVMSYHDLGGEPEKVYHALVLGMLVRLSDRYDIRSNRESGYGRYDLMLKPKNPDKAGILIEFKRVDDEEGETPESALDAALEQIDRRRYAEELEASGVRSIRKLAIAFRGKESWVREG